MEEMPLLEVVDTYRLESYDDDESDEEEDYPSERPTEDDEEKSDYPPERPTVFRSRPRPAEAWKVTRPLMFLKHPTKYGGYSLDTKGVETRSGGVTLLHPEISYITSIPDLVRAGGWCSWCNPQKADVTGRLHRLNPFMVIDHEDKMIYIQEGYDQARQGDVRVQDLLEDFLHNVLGMKEYIPDAPRVMYVNTFNRESIHSFYEAIRHYAIIYPETRPGEEMYRG